MKNLCLLMVFVFAATFVMAQPAKGGKQLSPQALAKIAAKVNRVTAQERALQAQADAAITQAVLEDAALKPVLDAVQTAKENIQQNLEFPKDGQDAARAGMIFESLMPVLDSYNNLLGAQADLAKTAGAFIAQQQFVTKDGQTFKVEGFIQQFLGTVSSPKLMAELADFKDHIRADAAR